MFAVVSSEERRGGERGAIFHRSMMSCCRLQEKSPPSKPSPVVIRSIQEHKHLHHSKTLISNLNHATQAQSIAHHREPIIIKEVRTGQQQHQIPLRTIPSIQGLSPHRTRTCPPCLDRISRRISPQPHDNRLPHDAAA